MICLRREPMPPRTKSRETGMSIASHHRRLERLEASRGIVKREQLFFLLSDWAPGCPIAFQSEAEDALFPDFRAAALDNLVAAGKIGDADRERVVFIVWRSAAGRTSDRVPFR
jgi:hypothetical protein